MTTCEKGFEQKELQKQFWSWFLYDVLNWPCMHNRINVLVPYISNNASWVYVKLVNCHNGSIKNGCHVDDNVASVANWPGRRGYDVFQTFFIIKYFSSSSTRCFFFFLIYFTHFSLFSVIFYALRWIMLNYYVKKLCMCFSIYFFLSFCFCFSRLSHFSFNQTVYAHTQTP